MVGDGGPLPTIMRTGAAVMESNHIHVAAESEPLRGTGIFHQSTVCASIQFSGDAPAQAAFGPCAPYQFSGSVHPISTNFQVFPPSVESCVPMAVIKYHQFP